MIALAEKGADITRRNGNMKNYGKAGKGMRVAAAVMMGAALMAGSTVSYAADVTIDEEKFVRSSFSMGDDSSKNLEEEIIPNVDEKWNLIDMSGSAGVGNTRAPGDMYTWTLRPLDTYELGKIYRKKGSTITVSCALSGESGKYIVAGIIEPDCTARAAKDKNAITYTFDINETGNYYVFARNINSSDITVDLWYYL